MDSDTPRATERSEGGRSKIKKRAVLTEQVMVRFSKAELVELEEEASMREWSLSHTIRARCQRGAPPLEIAKPEPARERFEEAP